MIDKVPKVGQIAWHAGSIPGFKSILILYLESKSCMVIMCNNEGLDVGGQLAIPLEKILFEVS